MSKLYQSLSHNLFLFISVYHMTVDGMGALCNSSLKLEMKKFIGYLILLICKIMTNLFIEYNILDNCTVLYCFISIHLYSAFCSAHQSEALPVRETQREESSLERTKRGIEESRFWGVIGE